MPFCPKHPVQSHSAPLFHVAAEYWHFPQDVHSTVPGTYEYVTLCDKGELKLQIELREMILGYSDASTESLKVEEGGRGEDSPIDSEREMGR